MPLSIDEPRGPFRPTLWTLPKGRDLPAHQQVEQVWFPGTHADVGVRESGLAMAAPRCRIQLRPFGQ
jgi:hypothetical protein